MRRRAFSALLLDPFFIKGEITLRIQILSVQLSASLKEGLPLHDAIFTGHCKKERDLNILGGWHVLAATVEQKDLSYGLYVSAMTKILFLHSMKIS